MSGWDAYYDRLAAGPDVSDTAGERGGVMSGAIVSWATITRRCASLEQAWALRAHLVSRFPGLVVTVQGGVS